MREPEIKPIPFAGGTTAGLVRFWPADRPPAATIVVVHGIQSHGGWYVDSCAQLAERSFEVYLPDRRGSGMNPDSRGDAPSFRTLIDDLVEVIERASRPCVLMGISWGGKLAAALEARAAGMIDGLILIAPGFAERVGYSLSQQLDILASRLTRPARRFRLPLNDPELFTGNPTSQQFIRDDPLALREATARLLVESRRLDVYLRRAMRRVRGPVLLVLAGRDRIIDNERTRRIMKRFSNASVDIREYPDAHHTMEFEPGGPPFVDDVADWIRARVVKSEELRKNDQAGPRRRL